MEAIGAALGGFGAFVLHGITGSGKTEVYLRLIERVLAAAAPRAGAGSGDRAHAAARRSASASASIPPWRCCTRRSPTTSASLAWRDAFGGHARIVLGTRSAVFAPVPDLGLIVVDEEHDASFKQHEGGVPLLGARPGGGARAAARDVPIVLGSATPALETLHNVEAGRYTRLRARAPRRAGAAAADWRWSTCAATRCRRGISTPAVQAIERTPGATDGQVLVFLNRRGYAPTLLCTACGWIAPCRDCDARLTVHRAAARLRCHHCGADAPLPARCPQCGFAVKPVGQGTERIEEALAEAVSRTCRIARLDRDVVRKRGDMEAVVARVASGEARILVGTQMVTKGHDFPNVTLVVVLNADQGLFSTDFRAPERLAQTIVQVAGRAGRGTRPGKC